MVCVWSVCGMCVVCVFFFSGTSDADIYTLAILAVLSNCTLGALCGISTLLQGPITGVYVCGMCVVCVWDGCGMCEACVRYVSADRQYLHWPHTALWVLYVGYQLCYKGQSRGYMCVVCVWYEYGMCVV